MTAETESLMLEILKKLQASISRVESDLSDLASDVRSMKAHMAGFLQSEFRQDSELASIKQRLDRVERRLDLRD